MENRYITLLYYNDFATGLLHLWDNN